MTFTAPSLSHGQRHDHASREWSLQRWLLRQYKARYRKPVSSSAFYSSDTLYLKQTTYVMTGKACHIEAPWIQTHAHVQTLKSLYLAPSGQHASTGCRGIWLLILDGTDLKEWETGEAMNTDRRSMPGYHQSIICFHGSISSEYMYSADLFVPSRISSPQKPHLSLLPRLLLLVVLAP